MPASPARRIAFEILLAVEERHAYASELLRGPRLESLSPPDRRLAMDLVFGVLRWRGQLDYTLAQATRRPTAELALPVLNALRLGAWQLRSGSRVPAMAAVHESVELVKSAEPRAAGLVNAALRSLTRPGAPSVEARLAAEPDPERRRAVELSHPEWMLARWSRHFGLEAADSIARHDNRPPRAALAWRAGVAPAALAAAGLRLVPGRLLPVPCRVEAGDVTATAAYRAGQVWLQDEASQWVAHRAAAGAPRRILDACAAPGGKTLLLRRLAPAAQLFALELHPARARQMALRLHDPSIGVVAGDAARPLPFAGSFDRILLDAPCTGTGTLARHPEIRWRLRPGDPARLASLQRNLLASLARHLAPGGVLVYSVCSIEPEEGADLVGSLSGWSIDPLPGDTPGRQPEGSALILPGQFGTDGFFLAHLRATRAGQ